MSASNGIFFSRKPRPQYHSEMLTRMQDTRGGGAGMRGVESVAGGEGRVNDGQGKRLVKILACPLFGFDADLSFPVLRVDVHVFLLLELLFQVLDLLHPKTSPLRPSRNNTVLANAQQGHYDTFALSIVSGSRK